LRKWAFLYSAAAIAVIGCGGSGNGSSHAVGGGGGVKSNVGIVVRLSTLSTTPPGAIEVAYLTGQGRAPGDLTAVVQRLLFTDSYGEVTNPLSPLTNCVLSGYQNNVVHLDVNFSTQAPGVPSRIFTNFLLDFLQFDEETDQPVQGDYTVLNEPVGFPKSYPAIVRVFPGRTTSLPVFIDDSMFSVDASNPLLVDYNESQFLLANGATSATPMQGFISDYISFNLNKVPAGSVPTLIPTATGVPAAPAVRVFFSGDVYAVSSAASGGPNFEALTLNPTQPIGGNLGPAGVLTGPGGTLPHAGTYSLIALNPTDITQTAHIIALQGIWREHSTVLVSPNGAGLGAGSYVVTFPSSSDNNMQEMVAFNQDGTTTSTGVPNITNLYFGFIDMDALTFNLYPVIDIMTGATAGGLDGTIGQMLTKQGTATQAPDMVHSGAYSFNTSDGSASAAAAAGLKNGTFYVFRL
jgi:hypothetical protein